MSVTNKRTQAQSKSISLEYDLKHPPEKVWRALTDPALLSEWLLPVVAPTFAPGAEFTFKANPEPGWDIFVNCRYLEIETHRKLSFSWVVGNEIDTVVTFTLTPTAAGTHLLLVQSGFTAKQKQEYVGARYGWEMMGGRLVELLARLP